MRLASGWPIQLITIVAALSGLLFGLDTGAISGALPLIVKEFAINQAWQIGLVVSALIFGALVGTSLISLVSRRYGRRLVILVSASLFMVCSLLSFFISGVFSLLVIRFILGLALGMTSYITPIYLAEMISKSIRGRAIAIYQLMISIGLLGSFVVGQHFSATSNWRMMLGVVSIPAFVMLVLAFYLPRSPRWLLNRGMINQAQRVLFRLLPSHEAHDELVQMFKNKKDAETDKHNLLKARFLSLVGLGIAMQLFAQWSGINVVLYYAPSVFMANGFATLSSQMICTVIIGLVNVLGTLWAIFYLEKWGRRKVLLTGLSIMLLSLIMIASTMYFPSHFIHVRCLSLISTTLYIVGFSIGLGPIVWIICAEIFPLRFRDTGVMVTMGSNWLFNSVLVQFFPNLAHNLSIGFVFLLFSLVTIMAIVFTYFFLPETKGVSIEKIESDLGAGIPFRKISASTG